THAAQRGVAAARGVLYFLSADGAAFGSGTAAGCGRFRAALASRGGTPATHARASSLSARVTKLGGIPTNRNSCGTIGKAFGPEQIQHLAAAEARFRRDLCVFDCADTRGGDSGGDLDCMFRMFRAVCSVRKGFSASV